MEHEVNYADKWTWMMNYCAKQRLPPSEEWVWAKAQAAFDAMVLEQSNRTFNKEGSHG